MTKGNLPITLQRGTKCFYKGKTVEVQGIAGPDRVLVLDEAASEAHVLAVDQLQIGLGESAKPVRPAIHDRGKEWDEADRRLAIIKPLINPEQGCSRVISQEVKKCAELAGVHFTTIYRWIRDYERAGNRPSGLKPRTDARGSRNKLLDPVIESIVASVIQDLYLNKQQRSIQNTFKGLSERCQIAGVKTPHYNTLRQRISMIPAREKLFRRARKKQALDTYEPRPGTLVVERPWQLIEIDHTPADILLVDETHRRPLEGLK